MASSQVEQEIKLDVPADVAVPDLTGLPGVRDVRTETVELEAQYVDTADLALLRSRITLRRRTGGPDEGWHLKLPGSADGTRRTEVHAPLGSSSTVPAALRRRVQVIVRGRPLVPVATLSTRRTFHRLVTDDARVLAEVCDDVVRGSVGEAVRREGVGDGDAWREWEVELVDGEPDLLDVAGELLVAAGAAPAGRASKVGRVLGGLLPDRPAPPSSGLGRRRAGTAVWEHLAAQVAALQANDPLVRADEPDAVHDMRVATRRLRSALRTFRPLLDREVTDPLRDELKELGRLLGEARDAEVLRDRLRASVAELDGELVVGPVEARLQEELDGAYRRAHRGLVRALDARRYLRLLDDLDRLVADPPWTPRARRRAEDVLPRRVRAAHRDVATAAARVGTASGAERDRALHEARKAAKRARYAAEAAAGRLGAPAERYAAAMEAVQEALGEHQDTVVARARLRDIGMRAHLAGENAFTWGLLHGLEQARADAAERAFDEAWAQASRKRLRRF